MMNINIYRANQLYSRGFTYRYYQEHFYRDMVFYYNEAEWMIGGNLSEKIVESDLEIIKSGIWLPSELHLMEWLMENDFKFNIINNDRDMCVTIYCEDGITGTVFSPTVSPLPDALACLIVKILKKAERPFDKKNKIFGVIEK